MGAFAGYYRGGRETVIMRLVDTLIAFPFLVLVTGHRGHRRPGPRRASTSASSWSSWTIYARITLLRRCSSLRERQFILAARTLGYSDARIILRHAIPNLLRPNLAFSMSDMVLNILALASLSYLGVGVQPPTPEWGALIAGGQTVPAEGLVDLRPCRGSWSCSSAWASCLLGEAVADRLGISPVARA